MISTAADDPTGAPGVPLRRHRPGRAGPVHPAVDAPPPDRRCRGPGRRDHVPEDLGGAGRRVPPKPALSCEGLPQGRDGSCLRCRDRCSLLIGLLRGPAPGSERASPHAISIARAGIARSADEGASPWKRSMISGNQGDGPAGERSRLSGRVPRSLAHGRRHGATSASGAAADPGDLRVDRPRELDVGLTDP